MASNQFTALYDASVLYPYMLRGLLVGLATTGLFRAKWTERINDEWTNAVHRTNGTDLGKLRKWASLMNEAVDDCLVRDCDSLADGLALPDADDRHVVAAAIKGRADVIVTANLRHFPQEPLSTFGIEPQHPDEFVTHLLDLDPMRVCQIAKEQREAMKNPPFSREEYFRSLEKQGMAQTADRLSKFADAI